MDKNSEIKQQFDKLTDPKDLESFGRMLSSAQMLELLNILLEDHTTYNEKLSSIIAGLTHENFIDVLKNTTPKKLVLLQHEGMTIPIQHQLTILAQEKIKTFEDLVTLCLSLEVIIEHCEVSEVSLENLNDIDKKIADLESKAYQEIELLNRALALAWNSNRIDLIDKLSTLKEAFQKYKLVSIGSRMDEGCSTGLYSKLEKYLSHIYGEINGTDTPAIEALAQLSIWHPQDYVEVGLLDEDQLEKAQQVELFNTDVQKVEYRNRLIESAKNQLEIINLFTLKDLKKANIYSKKSLKDYILLRKFEK